MTNTTQKFVAYHTGEEETFESVKWHNHLSAVGFKKYDFNKDGSVSKRARGTRITRYADEYSASAIVFDPEREQKANAVRARIAAAAAELEAAKDALRKVYAIDQSEFQELIESTIGGYGKLASYAKIDGYFRKVQKIDDDRYTVDPRMLQDYEIERINTDRAEHGLEPIRNDVGEI